jgi:pimeloyl-ACP methyl ester carboxylesterase
VISRSHLDRRAIAPGRLLYLTEPVRAAVDIGLLAPTATLLAALPRGDGHPVLVLPGLGGGDAPTILLRAVLRRLGYPAYGWGLGRNVGPTARAVNGLRSRLDDLTVRFGVATSLVGLSLGGIYARQLARRAPDAVRQVITLGSPVGLSRMRAEYQPVSDSAAANRLFGDWSDFPRWPHWAAWARWYARLQADAAGLPLEATDPLPVPTTSIYSTLDGMVGWRACRNEPGPRAENIAVTASHLGLPNHPAVLWAVADRLAQPAGRWTPFQPPPLLRWAYRQPEGRP